MPASLTNRPDPERNVRNAEISEILGKPYFTKPDEFLDVQWTTAVQQVRDALGKLDIDLGIKKANKHLMGDLCKRVNRMVAGSEVRDDLLQDSVVNVVRNQIGFFLRMRIYIQGHRDYEKLCELIREKNGDVSTTDFRDCSPNLLILMYNFVRNFGKTPDAKKKGWTLIREFLSEQTGVTVNIQHSFFRDTSDAGNLGVPRVSGGSVKGDAAGIEVEDASAVLAESPIRLKKLPRGVSSRAANYAERILEKTLSSYLDSLKNAIEKIDFQVTEITRMIREIEEGEKKKLETDMIPVAAELQEYDSARRRIENTFDELLKAVRVFNPNAELSKADKKRREEQLKAFDDEHASAFQGRAEIQDKLNAIQPKIDALKEEKNRLLGELTRLKNDLNAVGGAGGEEVMIEALRSTGGASDAAGGDSHARPTGAETQGASETAKPITTLKKLIDNYAGKKIPVYGYAENQVIARALNKDVLGLKDDAKGAVKVGGVILIIVQLVPRQTAVTLSHLSNPGRRSEPIDNDDDVGGYNLFTGNPKSK